MFKKEKNINQKIKTSSFNNVQDEIINYDYPLDNSEIDECDQLNEIENEFQKEENTETSEMAEAKTGVGKVLGFSMNLNSDSSEDESNDKEEYVEPEPQKRKCKRSSVILPDVENAELSDDGIAIFPIKLGVYTEIALYEEEKSFAVRISRPSLVKTPYGISDCIVTKVQNGFAVMRKSKSSDHIALVWCMSRLDLTKKVKASDGHVYVDATIRDDLGEKSVRIPISDFLEGRINSLMKFGISLHSQFALTMSVYFQRIIEKMPTEDASQKLGMFMNNQTGQYEFNAYNIADGFEKETYCEDWDEYCDALNELIEVSPAMQYLISVTMSAPVLTLLQKKYHLDLHSYVVNIVGASSTGKTITQRLCASMWTNPASDKIFSAMLSTSNAALKRLDGRFGIPTIIDEATIVGGVSPTEYAYSVYEEREKRRLNSDCSEKVSGTWSTIAIMSSEQHFHSNSKVQNSGMAVRVHSLENLAFTQSKEHADKVSNFIKDNYGISGYEFINMLFDEHMDDLEELYEEARVTMHGYVKNNMSDLTPRLVNIYAITYMTAVLLEEMGLVINPDAVAEIMAEHNAMVANEQNLALNAYRAIISYIVRNPLKSGIRKFETNEGALIKVAIEESLTQEILSKAGFTDLKVTIKEMDKAGYLIRQQNGRLKSKLTIDGNLGYVYQFDMAEFSDGFVADKASIKDMIHNDEYDYNI